jgi:Na+-driven multidrug efflux pump
MFLQMAQMLIHVAMDFLLLGYFDMGIAGLAIAGWISRGVTMIPLIILLFVRIKDFPRAKKIFRWIMFKKITSLAIPSCLAHAASALQVLLVNRLINSFGTHTVTGINISNNISNFSLLIINAVASGAGAFASQNFGAKHMKRIKNAETSVCGSTLSTAWCSLW